MPQISIREVRVAKRLDKMHTVVEQVVVLKLFAGRIHALTRAGDWITLEENQKYPDTCMHDFKIERG
jgi:hypothetical protein